MSDELEKAWTAWVGDHQDVRATHRLAFDAGVESQQQRIRELERQLAAAKNVYPSIREALGQLAARDVVIARVRQSAEADLKCPCCAGYEFILKTLDAAPASTLAEHDERVRTEATLVQHLWNEGKPFCGDESARPWYPADYEESLARPVCALCHKRAITYARTEERERCLKIAEAESYKHANWASVSDMADTRWENGACNAADAIADAIRAVSAEQEDHHG